MLDGKLDEDDRLRSHQANRAVAIVSGIRAKKVNYNSLFRKLSSGRKTEDPNIEFADMLAESRARARAARESGSIPAAAVA